MSKATLDQPKGEAAPPSSKTASGPAGKPKAATDAAETSKTQPALSTEQLVSQLQEAFKGPVPEAVAPAAGQEPSPASEAKSTPDAEQPESKVEEPPEPKVEDTETEPAPKEHGKLPEDIQARIDKRVAREVSKRKAAEDALTKAQTELDALKSRQPQADTPPAVQPSPDPVLNVPEITAIREQEQNTRMIYDTTRELLSQLRREPESVVAQLQASNVRLKSYEPEAVQEFLETARDNSRDELHKLEVKREVLAEKFRTRLETERQQNEQKALAVYPWMGNEESAEYGMAKEYLQRFPTLTQLADWPYLLGDIVKGRMERETVSKNGTPAKPAVKPIISPPAPKLPAVSAAIPTRGNDEPDSGSLFAQYAKTGDPALKERWMKSVLASD